VPTRFGKLVIVEMTTEYTRLPFRHRTPHRAMREGGDRTRALTDGIHSIADRAGV
jgi:hypothetical protein